ncbi:MAG: glycosyltransferase [Pirellulales bacterium]|nr:glycosyltransferase [Pirellulales bacterium]
MYVHLLMLNYNGRRLLAECLPSVLRAAEGSSHECDVAVIDNDSTDDSMAWLAGQFPRVRVVRRPNRGLCSFNDVVAGLPGPVAVLMNNDVKLAPGCIDPLIAPLADPAPPGQPTCFMTVPLCRRFDGRTYEGLKTAVRWRWGLVQATALYPGHEATIDRPDLTSSAGSVFAVDCRRFTELGGFDPLFLPGRIEDLDFAFRGYLAGYQARYVPEAVAYHLGMGTFGEVYGREGCDHLALRNTLLFQWKNLRHPLHVARQLVGLPMRAAWDVCRAPWASRPRRWVFLRAVLAARGRLRQLQAASVGVERSTARERNFFRRFHPRRLRAAP